MTSKTFTTLAVFLVLMSVVVVSSQTVNSTAICDASVGHSENEYSRSVNNLRNKRYCEVMYGSRSFIKMVLRVFSIQGLNDCPASLWNALDKQAVEQQTGASWIRLNGPRYWTMDEIKAGGNSVNDQIEYFGVIKMNLRATLNIGLMMLLRGAKLYSPNVVNRKTAFTYYAGHTIFELISPNGEAYVMQSYSQIIDSNLTMADLPQLGARLQLPLGWKYQTKKLESDLIVKAIDKAYVIQDDFENSYQRQ